jgi:hypothetical protein
VVKSNTRKLIPILLVFSFAFYLLFIVLPKTLSEEHFASRFLYTRDSESDVAIAFLYALRLNHEVAYEVTAPELWPRVDAWMATHRVRECDWWGLTAEHTLAGASYGEYWRYDALFFCNYRLAVNDIIVKDGVVVDWGEVRHAPEVNQTEETNLDE